jgi:hypothetical protein
MLELFTGLRFTTSGDENQVPLYDEHDRIDDRTTFTYGVAQRFLFRSDPDAQREERARLSIAQTYNLEQKVIEDHFSDIDLSMGIKPIGGVSVSGLTSYNPGASDLTGAIGELSVGELSIPYLMPEGASVDVVYRFVRGGEAETDTLGPLFASMPTLAELPGRCEESIELLAGEPQPPAERVAAYAR